MFVRWKKRFSSSKKRRYHGPYATHTYDRESKMSIRKPDNEQPCMLSAYLVKSVRIDGKPRQEATYLASIQRSFIDSPHRRLRFWQHVQKRIEPFNLSVEQLRKIKASLLEQVPDVTKEEIDTANKKFAEASARLKELLARRKA
jgi:hypothetical protein